MEQFILVSDKNGENPFGYDLPTIKMDGLIAFQPIRFNSGEFESGAARLNCQRTRFFRLKNKEHRLTEL